VYSLPDLQLSTSLGFPGEGWGLCHWNGMLLMSDGSERITFLKPKDFSPIRSIQVWDQRDAVSELNELEMADGCIYANKYQTDTIVKIDPNSGKVLAYINMGGLLKPEDRKGNEDVLNGIAFNPSDKLWYLTGKNWPKMFAVRWVRKKPA
jgi:glutaminyl-peptide cyclotransferase